MKKLFILLGLLSAGLIFPACSDTSETSGADTDSVTGSTNNSTNGSAATTSSSETENTATEGILSVVPGAKVTTNGWADLANGGEGMSYPDTTNIILIDDAHYTSATAKRDAFVKAIASGSTSSSSITEKAAIIILDGTVDLSGGLVSDEDHSYFDAFDSSTHKRLHQDINYQIGSNKAIIGVNSARVAFGGLLIKANKNQKATNIIIQNVEFYDAHGSTEVDTNYDSSSKASADNLGIEATISNGVAQYLPSNIWIDHCKFSDGQCEDLIRNYNHDGSLDVKAVHYMTVSYCEFTNHDKVTLIAPNDSCTKTSDRQITFHHNYYHGAIQRMPRSRGCQIHIYNNYYNNIGNSGNSGYSLGPGIASLFIVENCYFGKHQSKILKYFDSSTSTSASTFSKIYASGNYPELSDSSSTIDSGTEKTGATKNTAYSSHAVSSAPWTIEYSYSADQASGLTSSIPLAAGNDKFQSVSVKGISY